MGLANAGGVAGARAEVDAIAKIEQTGDLAKLTDNYVPAKEILQVAQHVAHGRIAQAQQDLPGAIKHFQDAVALSDTLAYNEPPYWYYPIRQTLGAVQALAGDLDSAEQSFLGSLARAPNNGWALYGLTQVYEKRGDMASAKAARQLLDKAWLGEAAALSLEKL